MAFVLRGCTPCASIRAGAPVFSGRRDRGQVETRSHPSRRAQRCPECLVGADGAEDVAQRAGLGLAARIALTLLAFAVAAIIWKVRALANRRRGRLLFPRDPDRDFVRRLEFGLALLGGERRADLDGGKPPLPGAPLAVFAVAGLLQLLLVAFIRRLLRDSWRAERALKSLADRREREADHREITLGESAPRLKNLMAIIEALAKFSAGRTGASPASMPI